MHFIHTFSLTSYLDTLLSYSLALVLGALIGAERQYRQRTAGLQDERARSAGRLGVCRSRSEARGRRRGGAGDLLHRLGHRLSSALA